ncbi:hypothetical protein ACFL6U_12160 [Planctomycetota bacterium]
MRCKHVFWYRVWVLTAAALIVAAYANGFRILKALLTPDCALATFLTMAASFCLMQGIKEGAKQHFDVTNKLWYASFSGFMYVSFILTLFPSLFIFFASGFVDPSTGMSLHPEQMVFLMPAFTILFLVILYRPYTASARKYYPPKIMIRKVNVPGVSSRSANKQRIKTRRQAINKARDSLSKENDLLTRK